MAQPSSPALFDQFARGWRGYLLVALIALLSSQFGAASMPVMDRDEARYAQASRQMLESGDYVRIRLQDQERNKKPIGIYWLQAASARAFEPITGRTNAIWPYRLPSALGAMLAAIAALWAANALLKPRAAFIGAALFAAGMLLGAEGMTAKTDAALAGFTTLALAALARLYTGAERPRLIALAFWGALAAGVLVKGPVTPLVAALALLALGIWEKRWAWMKPLAWPPGPLLAAFIAAPWLIAIGAATDGRFFSEALGQDLAPKLVGGAEGHGGLPGYHLLLLPFLIFPAAYALPAGARLAWAALRARRDSAEHAPMRFLLAWAGPIWAVFELAGTKLPNYVLPAYPAIALMCGAGLVELGRRPWRTTHPAGLVVFGVAGASLVALMAASASFIPGDGAAALRRAVSAGLIGAAIVGGALGALIVLKRPAARAGVLAACALALSFSLRERLLPEARTLFASSEAVAALTRQRLLAPRAGQSLWSIGYGEPSMVFLTRTSLRIATPEEFALNAREGDAAIVEGRALEQVHAGLAARGLMFAPGEAPVRALALGRGARVALYIGRITSPPADAPAPNPAAEEAR